MVKILIHDKKVKIVNILKIKIKINLKIKKRRKRVIKLE